MISRRAILASTILLPVVGCAGGMPISLLQAEQDINTLWQGLKPTITKIVGQFGNSTGKIVRLENDIKGLTYYVNLVNKTLNDPTVINYISSGATIVAEIISVALTISGLPVSVIEILNAAKVVLQLVQQAIGTLPPNAPAITIMSPSEARTKLRTASVTLH